MLMIPTGVLVTLKLVVTICPPVVRVTRREPVAVGVPLVPAMMVSVALALTGLRMVKFDRVTPSPAMTGRVVGPQVVNWPVKLTVKLLAAGAVGSRPLAGLIVRVGVLA